MVEMEWCGHCVKFCETRLSKVPDSFPKIFCSWCASCGKVLWEMSTFDIPTIIPRKRENESSERMKRMREFKDDVKVEESCLNAVVEMKWCDHCEKYRETRITSIPDSSTEIFCRWCFSCGRVLSDIKLHNNSKKEGK